MTTNPARDLLESAQAFLAEALSDYSHQKLRFGVVHAVTATELILKARLAQVNPGLMLEDIDTKSPGRHRTVSLRDLPQRLANLGLPLTGSQAQLITTVADWRNDIVHNARSPLPPETRRQLSRLLDFLATFLRLELNMPLETFLPKDLFKVAYNMLDDWQHVTQAAKSSASTEGSVIHDSCPKCGASDVLSLRPPNAVHCHLCGAALQQIDSCEGCGRKAVASHVSDGSYEWCDRCLTEAGEQYIQEEIDRARGK
jgi:ribosomal protein S27E